jgi:hypothetical protein
VLNCVTGIVIAGKHFVRERDNPAAGNWVITGERVIYGLTKNINSYNPLRIAFHEWIDIWNDVRHVDTWRLRMRLRF